MTAEKTAVPVTKLTVLVTRPQHQTAELGEMITAAGAEVIYFPVLEIIPLQNDSHEITRATTLIEQLERVDIAIFISANAVEQADIRVRKIRGQWPAHLQLAVVGRSSAQALVRIGLSASLCPQQGFNSEALLALPGLQQLQNKRIVIFRGLGGREKLAAVLRQRGAQVDYAEVYQRRCPDGDLGRLRLEGSLERINAIIVASNESLQNLYHLAAQTDRDWLLNTPLVVISQRCADKAEQLGFRHCCIAREASNQALFEAVQACSVVKSTESGNVKVR